MTLRHLDALFVGMEKSTYIDALAELDEWTRESGIPMGRVSVTYFDVPFNSAWSLAQQLPHLAVIYVSNEVQTQTPVLLASCRRLVNSLLDRSDKPLIVLDADALDAVNVFIDAGFTVDLRPQNGTIENALRTLLTMEQA